MTASTPKGIPASFRDPSGFLARENGVLLRYIRESYADHFELLLSSGLYQALLSQGLMVSHAMVSREGLDGDIHCIIQPELIPFISYPYEWSFSALKDAALATLKIQQIALEHGMTLKDASAFNIQFSQGRCLLIDSLSFERYEEGRPWVAYRQFCQHFLAPLFLMARVDIRLQRLLECHIDGIPLDLASRLLPGRTWLSLGALLHIHMHARSQKRYEGRKVRTETLKVTKQDQMAILDSLQGCIRKLEWKPAGTEWAEYYSDTNYSETAFRLKRDVVAGFLEKIEPATVWDLGANEGTFSRLASSRGIPTVAFDMDPAAVEKAYREARSTNDLHVLPLRMDLATPSPGLGWENLERDDVFARGPADAVLALALVHHLSISNNVPMPGLARFFSRLARHLIIEFVPRADSQISRMLVSRGEPPHDYSQAAFESAFQACFDVLEAVPLSDSGRILYWMRNRER